MYTFFIHGDYMDLQRLFKLQLEIENNITNIATIPEDKVGAGNIEELRFLALHIKLAELANLTKCYKYYNVKPNIPKDKLTLRFVDAFQYLLSIGNRCGYNVITIDALPQVLESSVIKLFSLLIDQVSDVKKQALNNDLIAGIRAYTVLFSTMISLGKLLKIDFSDVEEVLDHSRLSFLTLEIQ